MPNPASMKRRWAVRLSIWTISASARPSAARRCSRALTKDFAAPLLLREGHPALAGKLLDVANATPREAVPGGASDDQLLFHDGFRNEARVEVGEVAQAQRRLAAAHQLAHFLAGRGAQSQLHVGKALPEIAQEPGEARVGKRSDERQRDRPMLALLEGTDRLGAVLQRRQHGFGVGQEGTAGLGQHHAAGDPLEELGAQRRLEHRDATADRRLRAVQDLSGPREAAAPRDGDESFQLIDAHYDQNN